MPFSDDDSSSLQSVESPNSTEAPVEVKPVDLDYSERINFAFQQNAIPVVNRLEIRNTSESDWHAVECRLSVRPEWAEGATHRIDRIPAGSSYTFTELALPLELGYLAGLSERVRGDIRLSVTRKSTADDHLGEGDTVQIFEQIYPVDVYAYDEWTGLVTLPEILAAFVTPNLSVVEQLLSNSSQILGKRTGSSSLNGYQAKSKKRVYEMLDAIFDAVREQSIAYSNPAASFEKTGQRVRFGTQILDSRLGTCLDLSLLFAGLMEQAGLNALVLVHDGHAYAGCWLVDESFGDPTTDDLQSVRKRVELEELLVFETTLVCDGQDIDFGRAVDAADKYLHLDEVFQHAIDIKSCRNARIRPLPLQRNETGVDVRKAVEREKKVAVSTPSRKRDKSFKADLSLDDKPTTPQGRIDHWKQQLLDLTRRNRLLNFRETKQTIPVMCPKPEHIEDELAADRSFKVLGQTPLMSQSGGPRSLKLLQEASEDNPLVEHLMGELHAKRLRSPLTDNELSRRLLELYRKVRLENEESGANTLFLALGFLEWKENRDDTHSYRAPLLLVPVQLQRKSVQHGFSLQRHDEDTLVNVTLLELLRRDYELEVPGLDPLPEDESGVDVDRVFRIFQHAVRDLPGWEVHREVWLAQFSFNKFLLWKDLQDRADLLSKNRVVDHLINKPGQAFDDGIVDLKPNQLDEAINFDKVYCPLSSDSSQLAAVIAASKGKNFVLNGPPGTGKSQTITNLIAHCLAEGKRVLFVAEKQAALNVVHHRLSQIGLGPFCLELHSHKSGKAEVLKQFGQAMEYMSQRTGAEWHDTAARLQKLRGELNAYVKELHHLYPNRLSAFQCYEWLICNREAGEDFKEFCQLDIANPEKQSRAQLDDLYDTCEELVNRGSERRLPANAKQVLVRILATEWTPEWEDQLFVLKAELEEKLNTFLPLWDKVASALGLSSITASASTITHASELAQSLREAPALPAAFITGGNWSSFIEEATEWIEHGRKRDAALAQLDGFDIETLRELDTDTLERGYRTLEEAGGIFKSPKLWFLLKPLRQARLKGAAKWNSSQAEPFFKVVKELKTEQAALDQAGEAATARLGEHWNGGNGDWDYLEELLTYGEGLQALIGQLAGESIERIVQIRGKLGELISAGSEFLQEGGMLCQSFMEFAGQWETLHRFYQQFCEVLCLRESAAEIGLVDEITHLCRTLDSHRERLVNWCLWQKSVQKAQTSGLAPLLRALGSGSLPPERLREAFDYAYRNTLLRRLLTLRPNLRDFYGDEHQKRIDAFQDFDERYTALTGQVVAARLAERLPRARTEDCPRNTELGLLQRELVKKRRHKAVRTLLAETPSVTPFLKPCFLMSPLSVAQYLDPALSDFDLVVFDEASQIPVWDAIGAIARGKQVIVTGDPKQLPPTNFFNRVDSDEVIDESVLTEDLESILDECLGSGLKEYLLKWHYRSRKEGLIAFSNYQYYNNELHTFPAPHAESVGVRLVPVPDGFYDKGKSRVNRAEAEAIKAEIVRRLSDPKLSSLSIGVVTFSQAQQQLILDKMEEIRGEHPELDPYFNDESPEPVFVKNLENVQGDERDVILFSICYGPDQNGKISMNFGPLNRDGGERRLNVAVTRAKHDVVIFSTLRADQIDLSRTKAIGAAHLKTYLEYAERGPNAIRGNIESVQVGDYESQFEREVAEFLTAKGYAVHTQIGCSGYRIDLGIVHSDAPGRYVLGVECDGATYHRAATARDRDRLRQAVLEGLGWRIHRVWSTDWWRDFETAGEDLIVAVEAALQAPVEDMVAAAEVEPEPEAVTVPSGIIAEQPVIASGVQAESQAESVREESRRRAYPKLRTDIPSYTPQEAFYELAARATIRQQIERIIQDEGPIKEDVLFRRVAQEWGFGRVAARIRSTITSALPRKPRKLNRNSDPVFWPEDVDVETYAFYRVSDGDLRKFDEIPLIELCNATLDLLEKHISFPEDGFAQEVARQFDVGRVTQKMTDYCQEAIDHLVGTGVLSLRDGLYVISKA